MDTTTTPEGGSVNVTPSLVAQDWGRAVVESSRLLLNDSDDYIPIPDGQRLTMANIAGIASGDKDVSTDDVTTIVQSATMLQNALKLARAKSTTLTGLWMAVFLLSIASTYLEKNTNEEECLLTLSLEWRVFESSLRVMYCFSIGWYT